MQKDFVTATPDTGGGAGGTTVNVKASPNSGAARNTTITVSGGEKEAAQRLLKTLCAKYGVTPEELNEEQKKEYMFRVRNSVLKLFLQVYTFMFDATERYENDLHYYKKKRCE